MMEEPGIVVRWTMYFFGSGLAAISGSIGVVVVVRMMMFRQPPRLLKVSLTGLSLLLIACGSPALPEWYLVLTGLVGLYLILARFLGESPWNKQETACSAASPVTKSSVFDRLGWLAFDERIVQRAVLSWLLVGLAVEIPYQIWRPVTVPITRLLVIADSVTAGLNDGETTWPMLITRDFDVEVLDASQPGATLESATLQNFRLENATGLLVLEIGGNDVLDGLPVDQFENAMDRLLSRVIAPERTVIMFETPLPPFCGGYGSVQRRLARRYNVQLIPKRCFLQILTASGSTVDGVHLSATGQTRLAQLMSSTLRLDASRRPGVYRRCGR